VKTAHRAVAGESAIASRLRLVAETFLGRPYALEALIGGPDEDEQLVIDLSRFDCVTYIEVLLALSRSRSTRGFVSELEKIRYRGGKVDWRWRHHYFIDWMRHNEKRGVVKIRTKGSASRAIEARLSFIAGLPSRYVRFHVVPKKDISRALKRISDGTIVAFASVQAKLDFFHTGILFFEDSCERSLDSLMLYQARKSAGRVIVQPLSEFLKANRMRGIAFATPQEPGRRV
jgi:D-alanyl-D-alanine carboxypeptidase/D-alanyl-D-alanine-endopeptidase (penicillin-binding protein 4)